MVCLSKPYPFKFSKAVFYKFYLVHSWIFCPMCSSYFHSCNLVNHRQKCQVRWRSTKSLIKRFEKSKCGRGDIFDFRFFVCLVLVLSEWTFLGVVPIIYIFLEKFPCEKCRWKFHWFWGTDRSSYFQQFLRVVYHVVFIVPSNLLSGEFTFLFVDIFLYGFLFR